MALYMVSDRWLLIYPGRWQMAVLLVAVIARLIRHTTANMRACCELSQGTFFCGRTYSMMIKMKKGLTLNANFIASSNCTQI